jgi:hypothetical protein
VFEVLFFKNDLLLTIEEKHHQLEQFLISNLPAHLTYHSIDHIRDVVDKSELHGLNEGLSAHQLYLIKTAAWLHDIGYIWDEKHDEQRGCQFVKENLPSWGFLPSDIEAICGMIMATKIPQSPTNLMERVICDADLDYLGRDDYFEIRDINSKIIYTHSSSLRKENLRKADLPFTWTASNNFASFSNLDQGISISLYDFESLTADEFISGVKTNTTFKSLVEKGDLPKEMVLSFGEYSFKLGLEWVF